MGSCNPKPQPLIPPKKQSLQLCCKKLRIHLEIKQSKINQQIINNEHQLVKRINLNKNQRDIFQELLIAQRIVNGLKYTAAYTLLIQYAISVGNFASYICENINDAKKMEPWQNKLYTLMYSAQKMPLTTLQEYRKCMEYIDNQILAEQYTDKQIKVYLTPQPTPQEMNIYFLQMSARNNLALQKINQIGHQFSPNFKPKDWDKQFKQKSNSFRNSLPRNKIFGTKGQSANNYSNSNNGNVRGSISNPFDKKHPVESKNINDQQIGDDKIDNTDASPNITDVMKKINESRSSFRGQ